MNGSIMDEIEAEYDAYCLDKGRSLDAMYEKLYRYLKGFTAMILKNAGCLDGNVLDEVTQETLAVIATDKIHSFQKKEAKFTTFCAVIAKNKVFDYVRKDRLSLCAYSEEEEGELYHLSGRELYSDPEKLLIKQEKRLGQMEAVKKYLRRMVDQKGRPYRTVGSCYTMVLFHRHHPDTRELSSPKWAFETVREDTVEESADRFIDEMNEWYPGLHLYWGDDFLDGMEEREEGIYVSDIVFGEHFRVKDFENWSLRLRKKLREELLEEVCGVL